MLGKNNFHLVTKTLVFTHLAVFHLRWNPYFFFPLLFSSLCARYPGAWCRALESKWETWFYSRPYLRLERSTVHLPSARSLCPLTDSAEVGLILSSPCSLQPDVFPHQETLLNSRGFTAVGFYVRASKTETSGFTVESCHIHLAGSIHLVAILTPVLQASMLMSRLEHLH